MPEHPLNVSVTAPLTPAFERVKTLLFRPFDLSTWLVVGFCAWLAQLGRSGGGGGFNFGGGNRGGGGDFRSVLEDAREYVFSNLHWIVPVAIGVAVVAFLIWLVLAWLNSRGQFMFLHCVARHRAEISLPWNQYGAHANSLFLFRLIMGLIAVAVAVPLVIIGLWIVNQLIIGDRPAGPPVLVLLLLGFGAGGFALLLALVQKLTRDFVVPVMFLHTSDWLVGWRRFGFLLSRNKAQFVLYILFSLLLWVVIAVIILTVVVLTCCCAGCLMAVPYVGTVLLLPVYVFSRSYSLAYLAQYGPEFNVFEPPPGDVAVTPQT